jgi:hypothetical protein
MNTLPALIGLQNNSEKEKTQLVYSNDSGSPRQEDVTTFRSVLKVLCVWVRILSSCYIFDMYLYHYISTLCTAKEKLPSDRHND